MLRNILKRKCKIMQNKTNCLCGMKTKRNCKKSITHKSIYILYAKLEKGTDHRTQHKNACTAIDEKLINNRTQSIYGKYKIYYIKKQCYMSNNPRGSRTFIIFFSSSVLYVLCSSFDCFHRHSMPPHLITFEPLHLFTFTRFSRYI